MAAERAGTGARGTLRLRVEGLTRRFPGVLALDGVGLEGRPGEVLGVVGENGAGKSTLMKILAGIDAPDGGAMELDGASWAPRTPREAADGGVALIHQELCLAENLSVAANIALGREPTRMGFVDRDAAREMAREALGTVRAAIDPDAIVEGLSAGERQLVEIAKGLAGGAKVVIFDEPTSSLTAGESEALFDVVRELRDQGVLVLYVSHRLHEITDLCDRAAVLRDGRNAAALEGSELNRSALVQAMVGRAESELVSPTATVPRASTAPRLSARGLRTADWPAASLDIDVAPGEIVGIAGLVGAGRTELLETIFGLRAAVAGDLSLDGAPFIPDGPRAAIASGVALVPEDRKLHGLLLEESIRWNVALATLTARRRGPFVDTAAERSVVEERSSALGVRASSIEQPTGTLSGGNQQKVVIGRWLEARPRLLLLDEPTRGVDVGAREEIYRILEELCAEGLSVLFASSDLEELLRLGQRILVMHEGELTGNVARADADERLLMTLATGGDALAPTTSLEANP